MWHKVASIKFANYFPQTNSPNITLANKSSCTVCYHVLYYCIGYNDKGWSVSEIPLDQYQEKLQKRRREWEASRPVQPHHHQNKEREIKLPTQQLQEKGRELQEDKREIDRLTRILQERERELEEERREKERVRTRLQQQLESRERESQEREQQLQMEIERAQEQVQEKNQILRQQERESQERQQQLQTQLQQEVQGREREAQQVQNLQQQLQQEVQEGREREQQLQQEAQDREQNLQQQLQQNQRQYQERVTRLQQQIQEAESSWVVNRGEITMTEVVLGKGGWGEVKVAHFCGLKVAAKCLHEVIISPYNISAFTREMNIASKIRHPNLLQFIGATTEGNPIILTELMPTSLRKELETGGLAYPAILSISLDVAFALNYLHLFKPHPILHRDVSSANVLLQLIGHGWRAKLSDYGSANLQPLSRTNNPGNPVYSAPESFNPREHSPAMDVFSYGVLLIEMVVCQFPEKEKRKDHIDAINRQSMKNLIERCLIENYRQRPTMSEIIKEINESI